MPVKKFWNSVNIWQRYGHIWDFTNLPTCGFLSQTLNPYCAKTRLRPIPEFTDTTDTDTLDLQRHRYRAVRLKVEIHEIQFSEVTNYRNPRNPPPISRNPHPKKRNPTPATKSTATPPKANYRNPPALDGVCLRMAVLRCHVQSSTLNSERWHTSKSIILAFIIAYYTSHRRLIQPGRRLK